jgi:transposase-like protein
VKINGEKFLLWRAVNHEGEVLEAFVSKKRCKRTALKFIKKLMKKYGNPHEVVTDKLASYGAALNAIGAKTLTIQPNITTTDVKTLIFHFEGERGQCRSFEVPLHSRDLPPYTVPFTTILITKDI